MKKIIFQGALFVILLFTGLIPIMATAQVQIPSFIICGQDINNPCRVCHLYILADRIIDFLLLFIIPLSALVIAWGGIQYMLASGGISSTDKARKTIWNGVLGIIIAFSAWLIINTIISVLATGSFTQWNQFPSCP